MLTTKNSLRYAIRATSFILVSVFLGSCSTHLHLDRSKAECIPDAPVREILNSTELAIDTLSPAGTERRAKRETHLLHSGCYRRTYERGDFRIIVFRDPNSHEPKIQATMMQPKIRDLDPEVCLERALKDIQNLEIDFSEGLVRAHRARHEWLWDDSDIGPVKWLNCSKDRDALWYDSLAVFLHELSHEMRNNSCLFDAKGSSKNCWNLPESLPLRSTAKIQDFERYDLKLAKELKKIQRFYLSDTDQPPLFLFDELQAYTLTAKVYTRVLTKFGAASLHLSKQEMRLANYLPLFMLYSVRYLDKLRGQDPKAFEKHFGPCSLNRATLQAVLENADEAYDDWIAALKTEKVRSLRFESQTYREYAHLKKRLKLSGQQASANCVAR